MIRDQLCLLMWLACASMATAQSTPAQSTPAQSTSFSRPPPTVGDAQLVGDVLLLTYANIVMQPETHIGKRTVGDKEETYTYETMRKFNLPFAVTLGPDDYFIFRVDGPQLNLDTARQRLRLSSPVLVVDNGKRVDPAYLQVYRPDTLIIYIRPRGGHRAVPAAPAPMPAPVPAGAPPPRFETTMHENRRSQHRVPPSAPICAAYEQIDGRARLLPSREPRHGSAGASPSLWFLSFLSLISTAIAADPPVTLRPNVIIILADDLGWGDLGCYGNPKFKTPNLDRMAADGARLTNFYAACPFCAPTRASLMTGRYPHHCGMTNNPVPAADYGVKGNRAGDELGLPPEEVTLAEVFQAAGYRTCCIGKWHLGHQPRFLPTRAGFHEYFGILYSNDMHPVELFENENRVEFPVDQRHLTRRYTERALKFLDDNRARPVAVTLRRDVAERPATSRRSVTATNDQPFFLYFPQAMPHKPLAASDAFYHQSGAGLYGDAVAELDWSVGQVLDKLQQLNLHDRTLVLFTSDNGPWFGGSSGGLRGMKGHCWEGGIRVPLIARWPGVIPSGHVSHQPAIMMDLFATALTATGIAPPADRPIDGRNILPLLKSKQENSPHEALLAVQGEPRTIRMGPWKLHVRGTPAPGFDSLNDDWDDPRRPNGTTILAQAEQARPSAYPGLKSGDRSSEPALFNLQLDPSEQNNVAAAHPDIVARLQAKFLELTTSSSTQNKISPRKGNPE